MERVTRNPNALPEVPVEKNQNQLAALSYLWIFSLLILLAKRDNPFIQHHARRGTVLFLVSLVLWFVPILQWGEFAILALAIYGFIQASMGDENKTPILSELSDGTLKRADLGRYISGTKEAAQAPQPISMPPVKEVPMPETQVAKPSAEEGEERKVSALFKRLTEDEKELHRLEDEVKKLESEVEAAKKQS